MIGPLTKELTLGSVLTLLWLIALHQEKLTLKENLKSFHTLYLFTPTTSILLGLFLSKIVQNHGELIGFTLIILTFVLYKLFPPQKKEILFFNIIMGVFGIYFIFFAAIKPITDSMAGTLQTNSPYITSTKAYGIRNNATHRYLLTWSTPQRGDIVSFYLPKDSTNRYFQYIIENDGKNFEEGKVSMIKRIVATPHDSFFLKDGRFYLHPQEGNEYIKEHYKGYTTITKNNQIFIKDPYLKTNPKIQFIDDKDYREFHKLFPQVYDTNITTLQENQYFAMGDNRNTSFDSRMYGPIEFQWIYQKVLH
jgi:signal peptidase I